MATLKVNRGTNYDITLTYKKDGVAASLVGATVRFTVKPAEYTDDMNDTDAVISKDVTDGTAEGAAVISLVPDDTAELAPQDYYYDIKVEEADGRIYKVDEGKLKLDGSPTNRRN